MPELGADAINFLYKCFEIDPVKRWTAGQLLNHQYFNEIRNKFDNEFKDIVLLDEEENLSQLLSENQENLGKRNVIEKYEMKSKNTIASPQKSIFDKINKSKQLFDIIANSELKAHKINILLDKSFENKQVKKLKPIKCLRRDTKFFYGGGIKFSNHKNSLRNNITKRYLYGSENANKYMKCNSNEISNFIQRNLHNNSFANDV